MNSKDKIVQHKIRLGNIERATVHVKSITCSFCHKTQTTRREDYVQFFHEEGWVVIVPPPNYKNKIHCANCIHE